MEIIYELLVLASKKDVNKTHLMYQTNLCYNHFVKYLDFLLKNDFLAEKQGNPIGKVYFITDKGKNYIDEFKNIIKLM